MRLRDRLRNWRRGFTNNPPASSPDAKCSDYLRYFDQILPIEIDALNRRREARASDLKARSPDLQEGHWARVSVRQAGEATEETEPARPREVDDEGATPRPSVPHTRERYPRPATLQDQIATAPPPAGHAVFEDDRVKPDHPNTDRMRPQPVPCTATGLALSGGGIRSAAVGLGAIQALQANKVLFGIDYLSTVSGGGYIGSCLSASMVSTHDYPFGRDISDNPVIAHLRNYSNYLLPRGRGAIQNFGEAASILLRGILINFLITGTVLLCLAFATWLAWSDTLPQGSLILTAIGQSIATVAYWMGLGLSFNPVPARALLAMTATLLAGLLIFWCVARSWAPEVTRSSDSSGAFLYLSRLLLIGLVVATFIELQPPLIRLMIQLILAKGAANYFVGLNTLTAFLSTFAGAVSASASALGHFLKKTESSTGPAVTAKRLLVKLTIVVASAIVPMLVWGCYLLLSAQLVAPPPYKVAADTILNLEILCGAGVVLMLCLAPNSYSLNRFYRDRLSRAFLFDERFRQSRIFRKYAKPQIVKAAIYLGLIPASVTDPEAVKVSALKASFGPYQILNASLNVQGSREANKRGRDADFFIFTPDFVGSDLTFFAPIARTQDTTGYAPTLALEALDPMLDLGTAMAISGAAVSANMGGSTVRSLSPTLAFLNIRLGYWLRNPRFVAAHSAARLNMQLFLQRITGKFYLFKEVLNLLDETSPAIYLTDGGHIENLGIYELLKRGCQTIIVIDAESDPAMAFTSLVKLERFARIDLGIRIDLPWDSIRDRALLSLNGQGRDVDPQPVHCAVGRIRYADGVDGSLLYFKSSLTGDERDYVLDYQRRNPSFPHETTGDQFFSEEQFEIYRALGFHMVDGFFSGRLPFAFDKSFSDASIAYRQVLDSLHEWFKMPVQGI